MTAKFTQYFDTKIYWTDEIDGCGNTMIDDFLDATSFITEDKTFYNTLEWCSGPVSYTHLTLPTILRV